jgi:flagellar assembly protein FliH
MESPVEEAARIIAEARQQAKKVLDSAETVAGEMIAMAERRSQEMLEDAEITIQSAFNSQVEACREMLVGCADEVNVAAQDMKMAFEDQLLEMSLAIAERVVRCPLAQPSELAVTLAREAVELVVGANTIKVYISPVDYERHARHVESVVGEVRPRCQVVIEADERMTAGDCRIETDSGTIDQTIQSQMDRIAEELAIGGRVR